jgi:hypothetical protein
MHAFYLMLKQTSTCNVGTYLKQEIIFLTFSLIRCSLGNNHSIQGVSKVLREILKVGYSHHNNSIHISI